MTRPSVNPLDGIDRLLVDGTNLLHALRRGAPGDGPPPAAALVGRLRAAIPPAIAIELVLDGAPDRGMRGERVAAGVLVRHSGSRTADQVLLTLVEEARRAVGAGGADNILVVSDDRDLRERLRARGAGTAGTRWLLGRLERRISLSPTTGNARAPRVAAASPVDEAGSGWRPGRGATAKRGNPRREPRTRRSGGAIG